MKILFLIRSLGRGGAERQLALLARCLRERGHGVAVTVFYGGGPFETELRESGVDIHSLGKSGRWDVLRFLSRLSRVVRDCRPDIVHGYMPVANILATLMRPHRWGGRLVWGIRASNMDLGRYDLVSRLSYIAEKWLGRFPDAIIANSAAALDHYARAGIPADRIAVVPNGIDTGTFRPDQTARRLVRSTLGIPADALVVGMVGRLDPMKDHDTFLSAAWAIRNACPAVRFVCVGDGSTEAMERLRRMAEDQGIADSVLWLGARDDMPKVYPAFDLLVSSSAFGEGFSNVICEAMASGVPCVATDVGDVRHIVGDTGAIVPPRDAEALADAVNNMLALSPTEHAALGKRARLRIDEHFGPTALLERTLDVLLPLVGSRRP